MTLKEKLLKEIKEKGYMWIAVNDVFKYKRRNALNEMVVDGILDIHFISPSYNSYTLKRNK